MVFHKILRQLTGCVQYFSFIQQMTALKQFWKILFILSKKLFSFSRYSNFWISDFPSSLPLGHCFRGWSKINLKSYDVISFLNENLITCFIWYLEKQKRYEIATLSTSIVLVKEHLYANTCRKYAPKANPRPLFNLV